MSSCESIREQIHHWLDEPRVPCMPEPVAAHIRQCGACRAFISRWNAIELGLQGMRDEGPVVTGDFAVAIRGRLRQPPPSLWTLWRPAVARGTMAAAACVLLLLGVLLTTVLSRLAIGPDRTPGDTLATVRPLPRSQPDAADSGR